MMSSADRGVAPVVGVILMVAITVILAAVTGIFVVDLGSDEENAAAGIAIEQQPNSSAAGGEEIVLTAVSMDQADDVYVKAVSANNEGYAHDLGGDDRITIPDEYTSTPQYGLESAGDSMVIETSSIGAPITKLVIVGEYDGDRTVIQTYDVE